MTITFEDYQEDFVYDKSELSITVRNDKSVFINIDNTHHPKTESNHAFHNISKEQLKEFIGALLHVQSKIR